MLFRSDSYESKQQNTQKEVTEPTLEEAAEFALTKFDDASQEDLHEDTREDIQAAKASDSQDSDLKRYLLEPLGKHSSIESMIYNEISHLKSTVKFFVLIAVVFVVILAFVLMLKSNNDEIAALGALGQVHASSLLSKPSYASEAQTADEAGATDAAAGKNLADTDDANKLDGATGTAQTPQKKEDVDAVSEPRLREWQVIDGQRYYYLPDGTAATGTHFISGVWMDFDELGRWQAARLHVDYISQYPTYPYGCELVSATMMLNHGGVDVSAAELADQLPYSSDPAQGFTGSLYGGYEGGIIYSQGILPLIQKYESDAHDLSGASWQEITTYIDQGKAVCVWIVQPGLLYHTVVLTGYSDDQVWINDPMVGKDVVMDLDSFLSRWQSYEYQALSY